MSIPFSITYDNALIASAHIPLVQQTVQGQLLPDGTARVRLDRYVTRQFSHIDEVLAPFLIHGNCALTWHGSAQVEDGEEWEAELWPMSSEQFDALWQRIMEGEGGLCQK